MKRSRLILLFLSFAIGFSSKVNAQDPQFTQFYSVPLYLAPSFAGATQQHRVAMDYRAQWLKLPGSYNTFIASYDRYLTKYNSGFGLLFMRDEAGSGKLGMMYVSLLYSYDILLFKVWHVRPGLSFYYDMYNLDFSRLVFPDQLGANGTTPGTVVIPPSSENRGMIDGSASTLIYNSRIWFGFTTDHLLLPNLSFYGDNTHMSLKYTFYGGAKLISMGRLLKPTDESVSIAYQLRLQGDYKQLDVGLYWNSSPLVLGLWYRGIPPLNSQRGDALAFLAGVKRYGWSVAYSYDFTVSNLVGSTAGAHELSLTFEFTTTHRKKIHAIPCPEF